MLHPDPGGSFLVFFCIWTGWQKLDLKLEEKKKKKTEASLLPKEDIKVTEHLHNLYSKCGTTNNYWCQTVFWFPRRILGPPAKPAGYELINLSCTAFSWGWLKRRRDLTGFIAPSRCTNADITVTDRYDPLRTRRCVPQLYLISALEFLTSIVAFLQEFHSYKKFDRHQKSSDARHEGRII